MLSELEEKILNTSDFISILDNFFAFSVLIFDSKRYPFYQEMGFIHFLNGKEESGISTYLKLLDFSLKENWSSYSKINESEKVEVIFIQKNCDEKNLINKKEGKQIYIIDWKELSKKTQTSILAKLNSFDKKNNRHQIVLIGCNSCAYKFNISDTKYQTLNINPNIMQLISSDFHDIYYEYNLFYFSIKTQWLLNNKSKYIKYLKKILHKAPHEKYWKLYENIFKIWFGKKNYKLFLNLLKDLCFKNYLYFTKSQIDKALKKINKNKKTIKVKDILKSWVNHSLIQKKGNSYYYIDRFVITTLFWRKKRVKKVKKLNNFTNNELNCIKKYPDFFIEHYISYTKKFDAKDKLSLEGFIINTKCILPPKIIDKGIQKGVFSKNIWRKVKLTTDEWDYLDVHALAKYGLYQEIYNALLEERIKHTTSLNERLPKGEILTDISIIINALLQKETIPFDDNKILLRNLKNSKFYEKIKVNNSKRRYQMINFVFFSAIHIYLDSSISPLEKSNLIDDLFCVWDKKNKWNFNDFLKKIRDYFMNSSNEKQLEGKKKYYWFRETHFMCTFNYLYSWFFQKKFNISIYSDLDKTYSKVFDPMFILGLLNDSDVNTCNSHEKFPHFFLPFWVFNEFEKNKGSKNIHETSIFFYWFIRLVLEKKLYTEPNFNLPYQQIYLKNIQDLNIPKNDDEQSFLKNIEKLIKEVLKSIKKYNSDHKNTTLKLLFFQILLKNYNDTIMWVKPLITKLNINKLYIYKLPNLGLVIMTKNNTFQRYYVHFPPNASIPISGENYEKKVVHFKFIINISNDWIVKQLNKNYIYEIIPRKGQETKVFIKKYKKLSNEFINIHEISNINKKVYYYFLFRTYLPSFTTKFLIKGTIFSDEAIL